VCGISEGGKVGNQMKSATCKGVAWTSSSVRRGTRESKGASSKGMGEKEKLVFFTDGVKGSYKKRKEGKEIGRMKGSGEKGA